MVSLTKLILSEYILVFFLLKIHLYYMYFCMVSETQIGPLSSRKIVANGGGSVSTMLYVNLGGVHAYSLLAILSNG